MGIQAGSQAIPFGHGENIPQRIDGLDLLESYLQEQYVGAGSQAGSEDEDAGWEGWEAESDSDESESSWISVDSDGPDLDVSDSDDEKPKKVKRNMVVEEEGDIELAVPSEPSRLENTDMTSTLAATKVRLFVIKTEVRYN